MDGVVADHPLIAVCITKIGVMVSTLIFPPDPENGQLTNDAVSDEFNE